MAWGEGAGILMVTVSSAPRGPPGAPTPAREMKGLSHRPGTFLLEQLFEGPLPLNLGFSSMPTSMVRLAAFPKGMYATHIIIFF